MTYRQALADGSALLEAGRILFCDTPFLDAAVLLSFAAGISREQLFARYPDQLPVDIERKYDGLIRQRLNGLPVSYIRNTKEFFGRDYYVDSRVLVPRPDTETIIEKVLEIAGGFENPSILDLCTGSGCIAATLKLEIPNAVLTASDLSPEALEVAEKNFRRLGAEVETVESGLFDKIGGRFDIIATNPPYVRKEETRQMKAGGWPEPAMALDGGGDGLDLIRRIITDSLDYLNRNSYLLIEAGPEQAETIRSLMVENGFTEVEITQDLAGRNRITSGRTSGT